MVPSVGEGAEGIRIATAVGGVGELDAVFVHATGFCKEMWNPVIDRMATDPLSWIAMDVRGHGDSDIGEFPHHWGILGEDVLGVLAGATGAVGIGHSMGGAAVTRAAVANPGTFRHLILIEPIIFPLSGRFDHSPMSAVARKRRGTFDSRATAKERFRRGPFSEWTEEAIDAYLDGGFRTTERGFELKCTPETEADFFAEGMNHDTWDLLGSLDIPVTLISTDGSTTHQKPVLDALASQFPEVDVVVLENATHFVPMEDPGTIGQLIDEVMALPSS
ncbi:MAG: alpha/beta hydrolase [Actinomycetota bacterium]